MPSYTCQDNKELHTNNFKHINGPTLSSSKKAEYYHNTKLAMSAMPLPLNAISCQDPGCNDENHLESISRYYQRIVNCLQNSSAFLQVTKSKCTFRVPDWPGNLKQHHKSAKLSYLNRIKNGKRKSEPLYQAIRSNKKLFKNTFRQHKRNLKKYAAYTLASNLIGSSSTNQFWRQMRLRSSTSASAVLPPVVNGVSGAQNIANMWEIIMANYLIVIKFLLTKAILLFLILQMQYGCL